MRRVPLHVFVDFCMSTGVAKVIEARRSSGGHPEHVLDFYRPLREALAEMHRRGGDEGFLTTFLDGLNDERKRRIYPGLVRSYQAWLRAQPTTTWFQPPAGVLTVGDLEVEVTPHLGLTIAGVHYAILLHFLDQRLAKRRAEPALTLMASALHDHGPAGMIFGVLDVPRGELHRMERSNPRIGLLLRGEAACFSTVSQLLLESRG